MGTDSSQNWMPDFLEEMGLPASACFRGYVLYSAEQQGFMAINHQHNSLPRCHYVHSCAWAHRYPQVMLASDALRSHDNPLEIQALFQLGRRHIALPV